MHHAQITSAHKVIDYEQSLFSSFVKRAKKKKKNIGDTYLLACTKTGGKKAHGKEGAFSSSSFHTVLIVHFRMLIFLLTQWTKLGKRDCL